MIGSGLVRFDNEHPTDIEKLMYWYAGFYKMPTSDENVIKYVPVHNTSLKKTSGYFPTSFIVDMCVVEWDSVLVFDLSSETVCISHSYYDLDILAMICERAKELGFELHIMK